MQTLTKAGMKEIREAVEVALKEVGADLGVGLSLGNGSFRDHEGHFRLNVVTGGDGDTDESPQQAAWDRICKGYGFEPADYGKTFVSQGHTFRITGLQTSRPTYPISADRLPDGKRFKFTVPQVLTAMGKTVPDHVQTVRRRRRFPWGEFD